MRKGFYYILTLFAVFLLWSCSTKKNTKTTRFYHAFTTRYNVYYNGKVSFDEALLNQQKGYKESYSEMIHMYPISAQPKEKANTGGSFNRSIEKSNKAIKLHSIQAKAPKKSGWRSDPKQVTFHAKEEYNPFLKNSWLMLGQAQFYNADFLLAAATFSYISRHYAAEPEVATEARIWQARCYAEMEWFFEAEDILRKLSVSGVPPKNQNIYAAVNANYLIKEGKFEESVPYLRTAIKAEKNKLQRTRMKYLLGQILTDLGQNSQAYDMFRQVINASPPYELEFAARIRQTEVFTGGDYMKIVKQLERMAKGEKNKDMLDQVYYALGNLYMNREDTTKAIDSYKLGIEKSTQNGLEKALVQIRLGDIYFTQKDYINAQPCFSGAMAALKKEYKDYERVSKLSVVLDELVIHVEAVHLQDSLQTLARMPEDERLAVIDKIIEQVIKEEEEAKALAEKEAYLAEQEAKGGGIVRPGTEVDVAQGVVTGSGTFYFYNAAVVAQGKTQFQRQWGRRTLEDDWRRREKKMSTFEEGNYDETGAIDGDNAMPRVDEEGNPIPLDSLGGVPQPDFSDDPKTRDYYLQQIPLTEEDIEASNLIIIDGLYNMSMIYKDKLQDYRLSIDSFEGLERRFPTNEHLLESYYQIFLMALRIDDKLLTEEYKNKIINAFPESSYAVAVADPNYLYNIQTMDHVQDSIYEHTYKRYLDGDIRTVQNNYLIVSERYPLATLMPKFMFLDALTHVETGDVEAFKESLKALVEKYPNADVSELAGEMLKGLLRGRELVQGSVRGMTWNMRFGLGADGTLSAADSARVFTPEMDTPYRMLLLYPTGILDNNQLLYAVAAYNFANLLVKDLDLTFETSGPVTILTIHSFKNFEEIHQYYDMVYEPNGYGTILSRDITVLPISDENYETLLRGKTVDEYIDFFEENFTDAAPEMLARWTAHRQSDMEEMEKSDEQKAAEATRQPAATPAIVPEEEPIVTEPDPIITEEEPILTEPDPVVTEEEPILTEPDPIVTEEEPIRVEEDITVMENDTISLPFATDSVSTKDAIQTTDSIVTDSVPPVQFPQEDFGLTLKEIQEIRQREAEENAIREEAERLAREEQERLDLELKEQQAQEKEALQKQNQEDKKTRLKIKKEEQKRLVAERKEKQRLAEKRRKDKEKERRLLQKQKEKEYRELQKQKEKERKAKEAENKRLRAQREKEQREARKAKEAAARQNRK